MVHISPFVQDTALTGGFLDPISTTPTGEGLFGTSTAFVTATGETITTQQRFDNLLAEVSSSTNRILEGLQSSFLRTTQFNLIGLGEASLDISSALNEQITIREQQRAVDQEAVRNLQIFTESINERLSRQVTELGQSLGDIGQGGFDPIKFFTDNPLIGGIGIGGLLVGGVILFLVIK